MPRVATLPRITLRYFDARGRAQFLRYYFRARDVAFADERVPLSADFAAWAAIRDDGAKTGPFHKLPVLHFGERRVVETSVIGAFLHDACGDDARLSAEDNLRHAMLMSSLYVDVMIQLGTLLWADLAYVGVDLPALTARTLERIRIHFARLDATLDDWQWLAGAKDRPVMLADCTLWEEIDVARRIFGAHLDLERHGTLARFYRDCPGRPVFEKLLAEHPCQISGRPDEAQAVARLHEILAAGA
jgi:glutathione S-transferase